MVPEPWANFWSVDLTLVPVNWWFWFVEHYPDPDSTGYGESILGLSFCSRSAFCRLLDHGAVILTMTGGEAIYADMGHFGRLPIRLAWFIIVLPCLLLNYAGQGHCCCAVLKHWKILSICYFRNGAYIQ